MSKVVLGFCVLAAFAFSASLSASPMTAPAASPAAAAIFCTAPPVTPATPASGVQAPVWLSSGDCWREFEECRNACDDPNAGPYDPCWLACDCAYCRCEGIPCIEECGGAS